MNMFTFHTPERPEPLGLDLAKLTGGGSCPSQFYGKTHDGQDVYVRYRSGILRVLVANVPGIRAVDDGQCILQTQIGTQYDGTISLTQFCSTFGVTVYGIIPKETNPQAHRNADFTGQTTYWEGHLAQITIETSRRILIEACRTLPDALLVRPVVNDANKLERLEATTPEQIDYRHAWLITGASGMAEINIDPEFGVLPAPDQLVVEIQFSPWQFPVPRFTRLTRHAETDLGCTLFVPGERGMPEDIALTTDTLSMNSRFRKSDEVTRNQLAELGEAISRLIPPTNLERIDLKTGSPIDYVDRPIDPVIVDWCNSAENRWISITRNDRDGPWIGERPTRR